MSMQQVKRTLVLPGEVVAEGNSRVGTNVYLENGKIYAETVGLADMRGAYANVIPLKGSYQPKPDDIVIGQVVDYSPGSWVLDIGTPTPGILAVSNAIPRGRGMVRENPRNIYDVGDYVIAGVMEASRNQNAMLTTLGEGLGKAEGGAIIKIEAAKVPRLIGKNGSMINMIMKELGVRISVGQNGVVHVMYRDPLDVKVVEEIIRKIEREAHTAGLTSRIQEMLQSIKAGKTQSK
jgi:exosome complex component RRP4